MSDQKTASATRRIIFRSKGGVYSAIFMSDKGDLFQEYDGTPTAPTACYPDYTVAANQPTLGMTVTSSKAAGAITPQSLTYWVNGIQLAFNTSGTCTTTGMGGIFRKVADGSLKIIGNLVGIAAGAGFDIQCRADITSTEFILATHHIPISKHVAGKAAKFTIAPGDNKNFTITEHGGSCIMKTLLFKDGIWQDVAAKWEDITLPTATLSAASAKTLTVQEKDVNTFANIRATYVEGGETYVDTQSVLDASDPLDISIMAKKNATGSGTATATSDLEMDDTMPQTAYLEFACTLVERATGKSVNATWKAGSIVGGNGLKVLTVTPTGNTYRVTLKDLYDCNGIGEYDITFVGEVAP